MIIPNFTSPDEEWLVYADYLEEQWDSLADQIRHEVGSEALPWALEFRRNAVGVGGVISGVGSIVSIVSDIGSSGVGGGSGVIGGVISKVGGESSKVGGN